MPRPFLASQVTTILITVQGGGAAALDWAGLRRDDAPSYRGQQQLQCTVVPGCPKPSWSD